LTVTAGKFEPNYLDHREQPQLFKIANRVAESMTSYGFFFREVWGKKGKGKLAYGRGLHDELKPVEAWFPMPYVALPTGMKVKDAREQHMGRGFNEAIPSCLRDMFVRDAELGLPERATCDCYYAGEVDVSAIEKKFKDAGKDWKKLKEAEQKDLRAVKRYLKSAWKKSNLGLHRIYTDEEDTWLVLPKRSKIYPAKGDPLAKGDLIATRIRPITEKQRQSWGRNTESVKWKRLESRLGPACFKHEYEEWFDRQVEYLDANDQVIPCLPYPMVAHLATKPGAEVFDLVYWRLPDDWYDLYDYEVGAIIVPPIRIRYWDTFQVSMPNEVLMRFAATNDENLPFRLHRNKQVDPMPRKAKANARKKRRTKRNADSSSGMREAESRPPSGSPGVVHRLAVQDEEALCGEAY